MYESRATDEDQDIEKEWKREKQEKRRKKQRVIEKDIAVACFVAFAFSFSKIYTLKRKKCNSLASFWQCDWALRRKYINIDQLSNSHNVFLGQADRAGCRKRMNTVSIHSPIWHSVSAWLIWNMTSINSHIVANDCQNMLFKSMFQTFLLFIYSVFELKFCMILFSHFVLILFTVFG